MSYKISTIKGSYLSSHFLGDIGVTFSRIRQSNVQKIGPRLSPYVT